MREERRTVAVGGLPVAPFMMVNEVVETLFIEGEILPGFAVAVNAEKVISALQDNKVKENLMSATLLFADGISVVKTIQKKGVSNSRIPGCELWIDIVRKAASLDKHVYLLGSSENINQQVAEKLVADYGLNRVSRRNGYYDDNEEILEDILNIKPDIVVAALGSPKQEELIANLREYHPNAFYIGVGGAYDVFVGAVKRAPKLFRDFHLEWLFRLLMQPKRIFRYVSLFKYAFRHHTNRL